MQTYLNDEMKEMFKSNDSMEFENKVTEALNELQEGKIDNISIGTLPRNGDVIKVNGLEFNVISSDNVKGKFIAKIKKPDGK